MDIYIYIIKVRKKFIGNNSFEERKTRNTFLFLKQDKIIIICDFWNIDAFFFPFLFTKQMT